MNNYTLVRPEHLNHHGFLFGGVMLKWVDEFAWLAASKEFRGCKLVTVAMDEIRFSQQVPLGSILRFSIDFVRQGRTSATYQVVVYSDGPGQDQEKRVFANRITFVRVDEQGRKKELPVRKEFIPCAENV
ncbi:acyl-CoA thioesterase [Desulfonatronovibrio hydrogenovorans]|uniref:acyl-CoA thioesterase n=1 Tax=Desulfonatronovibrio hydrogenovorans TaxID=53245 RepID=UPI00048AD913|nr:acyl-CoA thioesterase [Desulfonatronovibrio hydrogenovorans]